MSDLPTDAEVDEALRLFDLIREAAKAEGRREGARDQHAKDVAAVRDVLSFNRAGVNTRLDTLAALAAVAPGTPEHDHPADIPCTFICPAAPDTGTRQPDEHGDRWPRAWQTERTRALVAEEKLARVRQLCDKAPVIRYEHNDIWRTRPMVRAKDLRAIVGEQP